jgi:hypothetical protein
MTTAAVVKKLIQPLIQRHHDLELVKRLIVVKPIKHVLRGVLIDGTSIPQGIKPRWFADHFFQPSRRYHLTWGELLKHPSYGFNWKVSQVDVQVQLFSQIEQSALPQVRSLTSLGTFVEFVSNNCFRHHLFDYPERKIVLDVALGHLDAAKEIASDVISKRSLNDARLDDEDREHLRKVKALCVLLDSDDREGMARLLHAWEAETVRNLEIEHLWEPTPFPLEMM